MGCEFVNNIMLLGIHTIACSLPVHLEQCCYKPLDGRDHVHPDPFVLNSQHRVSTGPSWILRRLKGLGLGLTVW